jgi:3-oxoacyl-[acyl-carrier-protein] synthase-3
VSAAVSAAPRAELQAGVRLRELRGVALRASAAVYPADLLGQTARFDAPRAYEELFGADWREQLASAGREVDHVERELGVRTREWRRGTVLSNVELGARAATKCLERAGWRAEDVDVLAVATSTPEHATKCFAAQIGGALGSRAAAIDIRGGGAGGIDAWIAATLYLHAGARRALVIAVEAASPWLGPASGTSALLYGDGAAALALESQETAAGLALALQVRVDVAGAPFSVPGELPPRVDAGGHVETELYRFRAPDREYRAGLARVWSEFAQRLSDELGNAPPRSLLVPYAVTREQVQRCAAVFGADPSFALEHLLARGSLGCAGPLAALAEALERADARRFESVVALAVGGGVRCAGLHWILTEGGRT